MGLGLLFYILFGGLGSPYGRSPDNAQVQGPRSP